MQLLRHASPGSALRTGQGEELSLPFFAGDIELNPVSTCYAWRKPVRRGMDSLQCQVKPCRNGHTSNFPAATSTARSLLVHGDVHQPRQQLSAANPLRYHTPYMCHSRLSTPCPQSQFTETVSGRPLGRILKVLSPYESTCHGNL